MNDQKSNLCSLLDGYVLDDLTEREHHEFQDHLPGCTACRAELDDLAALQAQLKSAVATGSVRTVVRLSVTSTSPSPQPQRWMAAMVCGLCLTALAVVLNLGPWQSQTEDIVASSHQQLNESDDTVSVDSLLMQDQTTVPETAVQLTTGFIGVPLDAGDANATIMLVYPSDRPATVELPPDSGIRNDQQESVAVLTVFEL